MILIKRLSYNSGTEIVFSSFNSNFYTNAINDVINAGGSWIDLAVYNITHQDLIKLKNICQKNSIYLRVITNKVKGGIGNYNGNNCEVNYLKHNHSKIFLSELYGYIGSYNFTFKNYPDIQCGVEFRDSSIIKRIKNMVFGSLVYNSQILTAETTLKTLEQKFYRFKSKSDNTLDFINLINKFTQLSSKLTNKITTHYPSFNSKLFISDIQKGLNISKNITIFQSFLGDIRKYISYLKQNIFLKERVVNCGKGINVELFKNSNNWYKNLLLPSYTEEEFIRVSTLNFNLTNAERGPGSLYRIISDLGKNDVFISIDFTLDQCKTVEDYSSTEIGKVALLSKLKDNHSKVFLSSHFLHIGSANFSLGSEKNFECGVILSDKKFLKEFEHQFFLKFIDIKHSLWSSSPIITESAIARDVLNTVSYFFKLISVSGYHENDEEVTLKLRRSFLHTPVEKYENLIFDIRDFQEHGHDPSYISFDIKRFVNLIKYEKSGLTDDQIQEFIEYLYQIEDFLTTAEGKIAAHYNKHGVLDKRHILEED